jgi:hypothetical protein
VRIIASAFFFDGCVPESAYRGTQRFDRLVPNPEGFGKSMFQNFTLRIECLLGRWWNRNVSPVRAGRDPSQYRRRYCGQQYYHRRGKVRDFWTHRIFRRIATNRRFMMGFARLPLPSMVLFGGVGGFLFRPTGQVRKCRPASGFTFRQTLMPEFDQTPFYIARSRRRR